MQLPSAPFSPLSAAATLRPLPDARLAAARVGALAAPSYLQWLAQSLQSGIAFAAHEPNTPALWAAVVARLTQQLHAEWLAGRLLGQRADQAFAVRCDRSTMTQADVAGALLVAQVGVAILKPAEFTPLRLEQRTAAART